MRTQVIIEDHVLPQLLTSAIEAYEVSHRAHARGKANKGLETFGLLWGYGLPARNGLPARLVAVVATVETSALRHTHWVAPDFESIGIKRDFFGEYWPQLELIGTFHSHPYEDLAKVNKNNGWRGSDGDKLFWPIFHKRVCPDMDELAHLVIAITALARRGSAMPARLGGLSTPPATSSAPRSASCGSRDTPHRCMRKSMTMRRSTRRSWPVMWQWTALITFGRTKMCCWKYPLWKHASGMSCCASEAKPGPNDVNRF